MSQFGFSTLFKFNVEKPGVAVLQRESCTRAFNSSRLVLLLFDTWLQFVLFHLRMAQSLITITREKTKTIKNQFFAHLKANRAKLLHNWLVSVGIWFPNLLLFLVFRWDYAALWGLLCHHVATTDTQFYEEFKKDKGVNVESSDIIESRCWNPGFTLQVNSVLSDTQNHRRKAKITATPFKHWVPTVYW